MVRLGIEAPLTVPILRGELQGAAADTVAGSTVRPMSHALCNQLNKVSLRLHLLQRQLQTGQTVTADQTLTEAIEVLGGLDREWVTSQSRVEGRSQNQRPKCRILVVDDESNERELLAGLLAMHGCDCATAADGIAALEYLETAPQPDFVLLDMHMPRCDGPQTLRLIRGNPRHEGITIFATSGMTPKATGVETDARGVDAWFPKPLNPQTLWDAMQRHLGGFAEAN